MAIRPSAALLAGLLAGVIPLAAQPALAQAVTANQPQAIEASPGLSPPACRLLVPRNETVLQPLRIQPAQVAQKNRLGCLSAADALYGPDGCPSQLCGQQRGYRLPLPAQIGR